jgi:hypothetical protein
MVKQRSKLLEAAAGGKEVNTNKKETGLMKEAMELGGVNEERKRKCRQWSERGEEPSRR